MADLYSLTMPTGEGLVAQLHGGQWSDFWMGMTGEVDSGKGTDQPHDFLRNNMYVGPGMSRAMFIWTLYCHDIYTAAMLPQYIHRYTSELYTVILYIYISLRN